MVGLDNEEASALATFRGLCGEHGLLKRRDGMGEDDAPDGVTDERTLLRFLQANSMGPASALEQYQQAIKFHGENNAMRMYDLMSVDDWENTKCMYPHWTGRRDHLGQPILMFDLEALTRETLQSWRAIRNIPPATSADNPNMAQRILAHFDFYTRFVLPLCSAVHPSGPVTKCVYVVDCSCLSLRQSWDLRDFARQSSWVLATCFPETIYRIYACNVPSYVSTLWKILKPFLDPVTTDKIHFMYSTEALAGLSEVMDHDNIPSNFGGGFQFESGMSPDFDSEIRQALKWTKAEPTGGLPPGPIKWIRTQSGEMKALATGTVDGAARKEEIATLSPLD
ncbi:CRAL/TRIO domain-containing protein [Aspergillus californicus]